MAVRFGSHGRKKLENRPPRSDAACVGSVQLPQPAAEISRCFFPLEVVAEKCANFNDPAVNAGILVVGWAGHLARFLIGCDQTGKMPIGPTDKIPLLPLVSDRDWRADAHRLKEVFRHEFRHPDATVRSRIARVHSDSSMNAHKIGHGRALEMSAGRLRIDPQLNVCLYDVISGINVIAIFARNMVHSLLLNRKMAERSVQSFAPGG